MGFATGGGKGRVRADINITPLVDVVLVLLIIFMVMTPMMLKQMSVEVPEKSEVEVAAPAADQAVLTIAADGALALNHEPLARDALAARVRTLYATRRDKVLFFDVADEANYGAVVGIMDECRGAGVKVLGIMTR